MASKTSKHFENKLNSMSWEEYVKLFPKNFIVRAVYDEIVGFWMPHKEVRVETVGYAPTVNFAKQLAYEAKATAYKNMDADFWIRGVNGKFVKCIYA